MSARYIFIDADGRLRSGWRFAIFCGLFFVTLVALSVAGLALPESIPLSIIRLASAFFTLIAALFAGWLCGKYLEGLPFRALGASFTRGWLIHFLVGIVAGGATLSLAVFLAVVFGGLSFEMRALDAGALGLSFFLLAVFAASEEAIFRGYPFQTFIRSDLAWLAIVLTSVFFGAVHLRNPDKSIISTANTILAGVWFGAAYLKTRDLWFVWGMHLMWNWMQGAFFGIEISGITDLASSPLMKEIDVGPSWLTGESYGVEGGIVTTVALVVSTAVIWFLPWLRPAGDMRRWTSQDGER